MGLHPLLNWQSLLISFLMFLSVTAWADEPSTLKTVNYTNQQLLSEMLLVDVAEQTVDKAPALVVTFSQDLDTNLDPAEFFTITQAGASKAFTASQAASASAMLLYDNSLPCNC